MQRSSSSWDRVERSFGFLDGHDAREHQKGPHRLFAATQSKLPLVVENTVFTAEGLCCAIDVTIQRPLPVVLFSLSWPSWSNALCLVLSFVFDLGISSLADI